MGRRPREPNIELHPEAWKRFEHSAGVVAKSPPQRRIAKKKKRRQTKQNQQPEINLDRSV
jgi:hypothetical protein